ncbi:hypothetical protein RNJ44_01111 [Nakaseomyces bracarensis]|uniref:Ig-like domain-containing protein n=1 Tax=Nakaseomyces bracarensis TaxID=273131 RepID=A0ABR4NR13_9SACH
MSIRPATHAGSWYSSHSDELSHQLVSYLENSGKNCVPGARLIVSPHAGYRYCGPTMAYSYASLDLRKTPKRVFVLGPSHHVYFKNEVLVSPFKELETPVGNLKVDTKVCDELVNLSKDPGKQLFKYMDEETDSDEHSLEMQFPMLSQTLQWRNVKLDEVKVIPLMVSHNSVNVDQELGRVLAPYLADPENIFIVSSDFCHWGRRFSYTGYVGSRDELEDILRDETEVEMLTTRSKLSHHQVAIWKSIEIMDKYAMQIISDHSNKPQELYNDWKQYLAITGNTICGERPLLVVSCALAHTGYSTFQWPHYSQSSKVTSVADSSVSYSAGYACI